MANANFGYAAPTRAVAITPSDGVANRFAAIYCGAAGNVKITDLDGNVTTWAVIAGTYIMVGTRFVWATGTTVTAGSLIGLGEA